MFRPANSRIHPNDRFIPRRITVNHDFVNESPDASFDGEVYDEEKHFFINKAKQRHIKLNYRIALRNVLLPLDTRILNFFPPKNFLWDDCNSQKVWPVKPRKKPLIGPPSVILDMPFFDTHINHQVADWSSTNYLATIFEHEVHMWYPGQDFARNVTTTDRIQFCVKWRNNQPQFSVGLYPNGFGIWDIGSKKLIHETFCCMWFCNIYAMEWINDNFLLTGCSRGALKLHSFDLKCIKSVGNAHNGSIISISSSSKKNFISSSGSDRVVLIWNFPELSVYFRILMPTVVKALAWHPWSNGTFATGVNFSDRGVLAVWNMNTQMKAAHDKDIFKNALIDSLTFNPISGELVIGCFKRSLDEMLQPGGVIVVLANMKKVVEELVIHKGTVPYLLWGNQGKHLASISADENLCVWDFFGTATEFENCTKKTKENKKIPLESTMQNLNCYHLYSIR